MCAKDSRYLVSVQPALTRAREHYAAGNADMAVRLVLCNIGAHTLTGNPQKAVSFTEGMLVAIAQLAPENQPFLTAFLYGTVSNAY